MSFHHEQNLHKSLRVLTFLAVMSQKGNKAVFGNVDYKQYMHKVKMAN